MPSDTRAERNGSARHPVHDGAAEIRRVVRMLGTLPSLAGDAGGRHGWSDVLAARRATAELIEGRAGLASANQGRI
jgi:hypothetical protein